MISEALKAAFKGYSIQKHVRSIIAPLEKRAFRANFDLIARSFRGKSSKVNRDIL